MVSVEIDVPGFGLAGRSPVGRGLKPMICRIAHEMNERILDQLQNLAIEFGFRARHFENDFFAEFLAEIPHQARQTWPMRFRSAACACA